MNYYIEIKNKLIDNEVYARVKDYSKERNRLLTYYEVGKLLSEAGKHYGKDVIGEYSKKLETDLGKKYNRRTLFRMKQFYELFCNEKVSAMRTQLTWSHIRELLSIKDLNEINYYMKKCILERLSYRQLNIIIKSKEYERLSEETKDKLIRRENSDIKDLIKNPIIVSNPNNKEIINEKALQLLILENIESFMKELGSCFCFIGSEYRIMIGNRYNYIDLLFNYEFNCFVVCELKVIELKKEHIGQIKIYMNYIDNNLRKFNQDKTIGIIICKRDNKFIMEYCSDERIVSKEYKLLN